MGKTLVKCGNSYGLLLEKPLLKAMHITPATKMEILPDGDTLVVQIIKHGVKRAGDRRERNVGKRGKKLLHAGNCFILVIDKPLLKMMEISPSTELENIHSLEVVND